MGPLLVQCSIHTNTSGHFAAYYKENNIGKYGGKTGTDIKRITQKIILEIPLFSEKNQKYIATECKRLGKNTRS